MSTKGKESLEVRTLALGTWALVLSVLLFWSHLHRHLLYHYLWCPRRYSQISTGYYTSLTSHSLFGTRRTASLWPLAGRLISFFFPNPTWHVSNPYSHICLRWLLDGNFMMWICGWCLLFAVMLESVCSNWRWRWEVFWACGTHTSGTFWWSHASCGRCI